MKEDKIFNNKYNLGDVEFEYFGEIKIDNPDSYVGDLFEEYLSSTFQERLYEIFHESPFYENFSKNKRVSKNEVMLIYYYFEEKLNSDNQLTPIEKFIGIAEFMNIPYEMLYQEMPPTYKEYVLKELDKKYDIFSKRKIKRLF